MIKVISFDIGGTLINNNKNSSEEKYDIGSLADVVGQPYDLVRVAYKNVFQKTKGDFQFLVNLFCQKLNITLTNEIVEFFQNKFTSNSDDNVIKNKDIEIIKSLKSMGYKVILFSNSCCLIKNRITEQVASVVDGIFYSYDIGYTKNEKESYKYIEQQLNNNPSEFLHIGDTLSSDYLIPIENGWNAVYYGNADDKKIANINNLEEIFNLLEKNFKQLEKHF
ncbi:MAG TPA: HAD family hydrolase [Bacilli bacterium]|nr:HAD family hydrolase [Bacilli bacterium]